MGPISWLMGVDGRPLLSEPKSGIAAVMKMLVDWNAWLEGRLSVSGALTPLFHRWM